MARSIFYKIIHVLSRKNIIILPSRKARLGELLFYSYAAQCRVPCMMLWRPPWLVRLFYFIFFPAFHAFDFTSWLYAVRHGYTMRLYACLTCGCQPFFNRRRKRQKTIAASEGDGARSNAPSNPTAKYTCAIQGLVYIA